MARPDAASASRLKYPGPRENLIVVEGADDFYALGHLCEIHGIIRHFRLEEAGGYDTLRESVDTQLLESGLKRIGFVVDADDHPRSRWNSLRDVLQSDLCGYSTIPKTAVSGGTVIAEDKRPVVGIWMMPDNRSSGVLEEFLCALIPQGDTLLGYADTCVENLPAQPSRVTKNWKSKARLHTWLAWRKESPGKPIGQAVKGGDFDPYALNATAFIAWVNRLFELESKDSAT